MTVSSPHPSRGYERPDVRLTHQHGTAAAESPRSHAQRQTGVAEDTVALGQLGMATQDYLTEVAQIRVLCLLRLRRRSSVNGALSSL